MDFPLPDNEAERLAELHALDILRSASAEALDGVCVLARQMFDVPYACIGLVNEDRHIFKANSGWGDTDGTSRAHSFGTWTILSSETLFIPDTRTDPRFASNIYVTGPPHIRFYLGSPLALRPGVNIGSLCIFGCEPRELRPGDLALLSHLTRIIIDQFRLHQANQRAKRELEHRRASQCLLETQSRELWRRQTLLAQTERMARVGGWEYDVASARLSWSDGVFRIYGLTPGLEPTTALAQSYFPSEARQHFQKRFEAALRTAEPFELELPFINAQGHHRLIRKTCELETDGARVLRAFGILQDITEQKEAEQRMWHMANHDALTDLPNRGLMREKLDLAVRRARRASHNVGVLLVDLDHFKDVNDTLGHDAGDALLVEAARRLSGCVDDADTVARLGGDEFIVLLSRLTSPAEGMAVAQQLLAVLAQPFSYRRSTLSCQGSIGVTVAPIHGSDPLTLLKNADIALYRAKSAGRGVAVEYDPRMQQATESRIQLAARIRLALRHGELVPYYQPKVSLTNGEIVGFEALMRWHHPRRGVLGPQDFGEVFDDPQLSIEIGEQLLGQATRDMARWAAMNCPFGHVAINVSSAEFSRGHLAERVLAALAAARLAPELMVVEVTESVFLGRSMETVRQSLQALSHAGVKISLDDFGTGYASLTHLKQFPVDRIKIDRSFVQDLEHDADDAAIVRAVIHLGRSLGIETVAEGVETRAQAAYLRANGCDFAQGFLYARALPASRVPALMEGWCAADAVHGSDGPLVVAV
ncbi:diguanylate cyclase (GGDEF)-like protein/PAS domain S-box-containing protein [Angulomicrobium tetraedrale]|uniref:Diguanylate cyclase (GGDEF)-like protein/PAS domain S-box-containing protein n=1 Tax=Ancylobacter tetraedralis TaxID=217068 RepID=A0A839Z7V1_9HYPH|nr:EAL domain-containing protein [Ancylobacter tetraedralis]MBB3771253.1 diguanylate cyclase (GGDEF)-like protein/PAS domain S-box-containing protein [Ancylobacter tetraedralis]